MLLLIFSHTKFRVIGKDGRQPGHVPPLEKGSLVEASLGGLGHGLDPIVPDSQGRRQLRVSLKPGTNTSD